jgi:outer membrane murein-binding lipoprotein Lpp
VRASMTVVIAVSAVLAGCASGPTDFAALPDQIAGPRSVRTEAERDRLEGDLQVTAARQASAGRAADDTLPSAMALAVIRQQQVEEARDLLQSAVDVEPAPLPPCDPAIDPACTPADR